LSNQLRREAEDYFLGILHYLKKGIPEVVDYYPNNLILNDPFPSLRAKVVGGKEKEGIDPATVKFYLNNQLVAASYNPETGCINYTPDKPLANGPHTFWVQASNFNGNLTQSKPSQFWVSLPPANIQLTPLFSSIPADGKSLTRIEVEVTDEYGNPVIDGTLVKIKAFWGKLSSPTIATSNGRGVTHFFSPPETGKALIEAKSGGAKKKITIGCEPVNYGLMQLVITDIQNNPLEGVIVREGDTVVDISDKFGWAFISSSNISKNEKIFILTKSGYESKRCRVNFCPGKFNKGTFTLQPREGGLLLGRKITLDPEPEIEKPQKIFRNESKDSEFNFLVAQKLQALLEEAGALTILTQSSSDEHPMPAERVVAGEKFKGEYFITITNRKGDSYIAHYFLSERGKKLAHAIAKALTQGLKLKEVKVQEGLDFTIIHPSAPSILINLGDKNSEQEINEALAEKEAQSIYRGLVDYLKNK
ncbi:MAG: N-acetylmuramoyl-L-alanine amidase, partial [Desulfobacterota bacterium]|nr:N-acetylmuramoyl-L-alanine amidase [Thermodesulfobacteriota bacterium]